MALLGAAVAVAAPPACVAGPGREDVGLQRLQTRMCEKARDCGCAPPSSDEVADSFQCGDWRPIEPDIGFDTGFDGGSYRASLAFDPACVERWILWVDALSCEVPTRPSYAELCPLYHGTRREGDACEEGSSLAETDCDRGLYCIVDVCRDPSRTAFGTAGEPCDVGGLCNEGLACIDSLCQRLPSAGELCLDYRCNAESYCDDGLCEALPRPGERCDRGECVAGSYCRFDPALGRSVCQPAVDVGEPCSGHRQCQSGNCPAGFCEEPADVGDPCGSQLPCGPDLLCDEGQCRPAGDGVSVGSACTVLDI